MRKIILLSFVLASVKLFAQEQQLRNVFVSNISNPPSQLLQVNLINTSNINDDNNGGNQMVQQGNFNEDNQNKAQSAEQSGNSNVRQSNSANSNGVSFNFSFSRSSSASSNAKSHKHTFSKKLKKFERNFYGKMGSHKKSKHLVDVCFNWTK